MPSTSLDRVRMLMGDGVGDGDVLVDEPAQQIQMPDPAVKRAEGEVAQTGKHPTAQADHRKPQVDDDTQRITLEKALSWKDDAKEANSYVQGKLGPPGSYCAILAVSKFPYKYMDPKSQLSETVSKRFFADNRFWKNVWNVYYLHVPTTISAKPLLLIPKAEVQEFLRRITGQSGIRLNFPSESGGFVTCFENDGSPLPRYLGMSTCREEFYSLEEAVPPVQLDFPAYSDGTTLANCDQRTFEEWAAKVERAVAATKNKNKASKEKRKLQRVQIKADWSRQLRRAERYFGLRGVTSPNPGSTGEQHSPNQGDPIPRGLSSEADATIDLTAVAPYPCDSDVIIFGIDVEVYEHGQKQVTEIGLAFVDTRDLVNVSPGDGGKNWMEKVKGRHLWIREYAHLKNEDYVAGCPDRYEKCFGISEVVTTQEAVKILENCFEDPTLAGSRSGWTSTSAKREAGSGNQSATKEQATKSSSTCADMRTTVAAPRKIVVVGHDITQDINYLNLINFNLLTNPNVLEILDTSELYRTMRREDNAPSVSTMLYNLGICGWNLHNAGNDAGYTLQALIGIVIRSMTRSRERHTDATALIEKAKREAEDRIRDNLEEWELAEENDNGDGGAPKSPSLRATPKKKRERIQAGEAI